VSLIILESQLAYPVKKGSLRIDSFSLWLDGNKLPHLKETGEESNDRGSYYFKKVTGKG